ncbi:MULTISPECIES: hypothetical protein [unclassified Microbacterium]|uniref:hypothetical protein n=1 Tax=unclassified Microbacterium TaxID=2609290 RepID=UPI000F553CEF|nr:hypothetical protein [Microbacterium sp. ABRD28]AZC13705.1 hypothetical protein DT073_08265 [Microbacterium sp. ABRD28]
MYNDAVSSMGAGAGAGALAATGFDSLWLGLAAFALIAAGMAVMRIVPRRRRALAHTPPE